MFLTKINRYECPELTLPLKERRARRRRFERMEVGSNAMRKREMRRLPSETHTKHGVRKEQRQLLRYARRRLVANVKVFMLSIGIDE